MPSEEQKPKNKKPEIPHPKSCCGSFKTKCFEPTESEEDVSSDDGGDHLREFDAQKAKKRTAWDEKGSLLNRSARPSSLDFAAAVAALSCCDSVMSRHFNPLAARV